MLTASEASLPQRVAEKLPTLTEVTVVSYALLPEGLAIWVYDDRGVVSHWAEGNAADISASAEHFRALCADPTSDALEVQQSGRSLYNVLVAPVEQYLSADRTLLIELDDGISGLPFDALLDSQNHYFGDRYTALSSLGIYYLPAVHRKLMLHTDSTALIIAVPHSRAAAYASELPLADVLSEGEMVARNFSESHLLTQESATVNSVLLRLPNAAVFHFAGHAVSSPVQSGLVLSDDLLNTQSMEKISLPRMQLAVFSACDTQDGDSGSPDNLVRAFLRAGAARVVASRWDVDSRVTREFMELFYQALLNGNTVGAALHQAQSSVRLTPGLAHPYYWSAFTAFGAV
jgi:CHAT domain-containing protein